MTIVTGRAQAIAVRRNPSKGILIEGEVTAPPCSDPETVNNFKIEAICDFLNNVSRNNEAFLKLMKFTKQSPVFVEEYDEYFSIYSKVRNKFGFSLKKKIEVCYQKRYTSMPKILNFRGGIMPLFHCAVFRKM